MPLSNPGSDPLQPLANDPSAQRVNAGAHGSGLFLPAIGAIPINLRPEDAGLLQASMPQEPAAGQGPQEPAGGVGPREREAQARIFQRLSDQLQGWGEHHSLALTGGVLGKEHAIAKSVDPIDRQVMDFWESLGPLVDQIDPTVLQEIEESGGFTSMRYSSEMLAPMARVQARRDVDDWARSIGVSNVSRLFQDMGEMNGVPIMRIPDEVAPALLPKVVYDAENGHSVHVQDSAGRPIYYLGEEMRLAAGGAAYRHQYGEVVRDEYGWLPRRLADPTQYNIFERRALSMLEGNTLAGAIKQSGTEKAWVGVNTYADMLSMGLLSHPDMERYSRQAGSLASPGERRASIAGDLLSFVTPGGAPNVAFKAGRSAGVGVLKRMLGRGAKEAAGEVVEGAARKAASEQAKVGFLKGLSSSKLGQFTAGATGAVAGGTIWDSLRPESGSEEAIIDAWAAEMMALSPNIGPEQALAEAEQELASMRFEGSVKMFTLLEFGLNPAARGFGKLAGKVGRARGASAARKAEAGKPLTRESKLISSLRMDRAQARYEGIASGAFIGTGMAAISPEVRSAWVRWWDSGFEDEEAYNQLVDGWWMGAGIFAAHGALTGAHAVTKNWREMAQGARESAKEVGEAYKESEAKQRETRAAVTPPGEEPAQSAPKEVGDEALDAAWREANLAIRIAKIEEEIARRGGMLRESYNREVTLDSEIVLIRAQAAQRIADAMKAYESEVSTMESKGESNEQRVQAAKGRAAKFHQAVTDFVAEAGWDRQVAAIIDSRGGLEPGLGEAARKADKVEKGFAQYSKRLYQEIDSLAEKHNERMAAEAKVARAGLKEPKTAAGQALVKPAEKAAAIEYDAELSRLLGPDGTRSPDIVAEVEQRIRAASERYGLKYEEIRSRLLRGWDMSSMSQREMALLQEVAQRHGVNPDWILDYLTRPDAPTPLDVQIGTRRRVPAGLLPAEGETSPTTLPEKLPSQEQKDRTSLRDSRIDEKQVGKEPGTTATLKAVEKPAATTEEAKPKPTATKEPVAEQATDKSAKPEAPKPVRQKAFEPTGAAPKAAAELGEDVQSVDRKVRTRMFELMEPLPGQHRAAVLEFMNEADRKKQRYQEWAAVRAVEEAAEQGGIEATTPRSLARRARTVLDWLERKADLEGDEGVIKAFRGEIPKDPPAKMTVEEVRAKIARAAGGGAAAEATKSAEAPTPAAKPVENVSRETSEKPVVKETQTKAATVKATGKSAAIETEEFTITTESVDPKRLTVGEFQKDRQDIGDKENLVNPDREIFTRPWDPAQYATNPILAVEMPGGEYKVVSGHHRRARALGLHGSPDKPEGAIPIRVLRMKPGVPAERAQEIAQRFATIENLGGQRLTKIELIGAVRERIAKGQTQKQIGADLGISERETRDVVNLSALPDPILDLVRQGVLDHPGKIARLGQSVRENSGLWTPATSVNFVQRLGPKAINDMSAQEWSATLERMETRYQQARYNRLEQRLPGLERTIADIADEVVNYGVERSKEALKLERQVAGVERTKKSMEGVVEALGEDAAATMREALRKMERELIDMRERLERLDRGEVLEPTKESKASAEQGPSLFGDQAKAEWSRSDPGLNEVNQAIAAESQRFADDHLGIVGYDAQGKLVARGMPGETSVKDLAGTEADLLEGARRHGIHKLLGFYRVGEAGGKDYEVESAGLKAKTYTLQRGKAEATQKATQEATSLFDGPAQEVDLPVRIEFRGQKLNEHEKQTFQEAVTKTFDPKSEHAGLFGVDKDGNLVAVDLFTGTADQVVIDHVQVEGLARKAGIRTVLGLYHTHPKGELPSLADHKAAADLAERLAGVPLYVHTGTELHEVVPMSKERLSADVLDGIRAAESRLKEQLDAYREAKAAYEALDDKDGIVGKMEIQELRERRALTQKAELEYFKALDDAGLGNEANPVWQIRRHKEQLTFKRYVEIVHDAEPGASYEGVLKAPPGQGRSFFGWLVREWGLVKPQPEFLEAAYEARKAQSPTAIFGKFRSPRNYVTREIWNVIVREDHNTLKQLDRLQRVLYGRSIEDRMRYGDRPGPNAPLTKIARGGAESARVSAALDGWTVKEWNASDAAKEHGAINAPDAAPVEKVLGAAEREVFTAADSVLTRIRRQLWEHISREQRAEVERQLREAKSDLKHYTKVRADLSASTKMPPALKASSIAKADRAILAAQAEAGRQQKRLDLISDLRDPDTGERWGIERFFHHVWEEDGSGKGYENMSPLSRRSMSKEKWVSTLQKRKGRSGFMLDVHKMFDVYIPDVVGKIALDKVLAAGNDYVYGERTQAWGLKDLYRDWHTTRSSMRLDMALIHMSPDRAATAQRSRFAVVPGSARYDGERLNSIEVQDISTGDRRRVFNSRADAAEAGDPDAPLARHFLVRRGGLAEALKDPDKSLREIEYVEKLLNRISGRRQAAEIDQAITKIARVITEYEYHAYLGLLNPKSAVTNLIFGGTQLVAELGPVWAAKGFAAASKLATTLPHKSDAESRRLWKILRTGGAHLESFVGWDEQGLRGMGHPQDPVSKGYQGFKDASFFLFRNSEKYIRAASYFAGYLAAESRGWSAERCHRFAREVISNTQFDMSAYAAPALTHHPLGFMFVMLRRYALNFLEKHVRGAAGVGHLTHANITRALGATPSHYARQLAANATRRPLDKDLIEAMDKHAEIVGRKKNSVEHIYNAGFLMRSILAYSAVTWLYKELTGRDPTSQWGSTAHDIPILAPLASRFESTTVGSAVSSLPVPGLTGPFDLFTPSIKAPVTAVHSALLMAAGDSTQAKEVFWKSPETWMGRTPYWMYKTFRSAKPDPFNEGKVTVKKPGSDKVHEVTTTAELWGDLFLPGTKNERKKQFQASRAVQYDANRRASLRDEINNHLGSGDAERTLRGVELAVQNGIVINLNEIPFKILQRAASPSVRGVFNQPDKEMRVKYAAKQLPNLEKGEVFMLLYFLGFDGSGDWHRDEKGNALVTPDTLSDFYGALSNRIQEF